MQVEFRWDAAATRWRKASVCDLWYATRKQYLCYKDAVRCSRVAINSGSRSLAGLSGSTLMFKTNVEHW